MAKIVKDTAEEVAAAAPAWTWEIRQPDGEAALVRAPGPLEAMRLYLQEHAAPEGAPHAYTVRPACAGCPFPEVTVEVRWGNDGKPALQPWADPLEWAEAVAAAAGKKLLAEQRRYLQGPIIVGSNFWTDIPEWLCLAIPKARLRQVFLELTGAEGAEIAGLATIEEVAAYLMAASLDAPLTQDAAETYFYATAQVLALHGMVESVEAFWNMLDGGMSGNTNHELTEYQQMEVLRPLQRRIRQSVAGHAPREGKRK